MKVPFLKKIATKLLFFPFLFMLMVFSAFCAGFYYLGPQNPFRDLPEEHLINLVSEKKLPIDMWFEQGKQSIEYLSKNDIIREAVFTYTAPETVTKKRREAADAMRQTAGAATLRLLDDMVLSSPWKMFALLLKNGTIISSTQKELIGSDWSDRDFVASTITELQSPSVRVLYGADRRVVFLAPVFDNEKNMIGLIYGVPNDDKLAGLLRVERGVYKTEKIEMLDSEGNLVLTRKGFPDKLVKYNLPKNETGNVVRLRDNLFFCVVALENAPFRLIATIDKQEVLQPLIIVLVLCAIFSGLIIIVLVFKTSYSGSKLISKPVARLINATKAVAEGGLDNINLGKDYKGELLELKKAFESMIEELMAKEAMQGASLKSSVIVPTAPFVNISSELRTPLYSISGAAEGVIKSEKHLNDQSRKALYDMLSSSKALLLLVDNLHDYAQLTQGKQVFASEPFNLCELFDEIASSVKELAGMKEIEVVVDCQEVFITKMVHTDRSLLKKLLLNLASNAVKNTGVGTITILATERLKEGVEYIEISVADTGKGLSSHEMEHLFEDIASPHSSLGLIISKKMAEILGGSLQVESRAGKGSVFTAIIPIKAILY